MYVCVCFAVTEDEIRNVIDDGANTREAVTRACRAGGDCGSCHAMIGKMISDAKAEAHEHGPGAPIPCDRLVRRRSGEAA